MLPVTYTSLIIVGGKAPSRVNRSGSQDDRAASSTTKETMCRALETASAFTVPQTSIIP